MKRIEAQAIISARDATKNVFEQIAAKIKGVEKVAKSFEGIKAPSFTGNMFEELRRLKLSEKELQGVRKEFSRFHDALRSAPIKMDHYTRAIGEKQGEIVQRWREIKSGAEEADKAHKKFFAGGGAGRLAKAVGAFVPGYLAYQGGRAAVEANAVSQREGARDYLAGLPETDSKRLGESARQSSGRYPSVDASTMHQSLRDLAMSSRSMDLAVEMADTVAKGFVVLQSLKGKDKAIEESRKFFAALDVLGKNVDAKEVKDLYGGFVKAMAVEGADMDMGGVLAMARRLKAAGATISNRFLMTTGAGLARDLGDEKAGNALSMMQQQEVQATKQAKEYGEKYGLRDSSGKFVDRSEMMHDPDYWAWKNVTASMKRAGLDPDKAEDVNTFLQSAYSNSSARDVLSKLMTQRQQYEGKAVQYEKSPGPGAASELAKRDPFVALEGVQAQMRNLAAQAPVMDAAAAGLNKLTSAIVNINDAISNKDWSKILPSVTDLLPKNEVRDAKAIAGVISSVADFDRKISDPVKNAIKSIFDSTGAARLGGARKIDATKRLDQWPASGAEPLQWAPAGAAATSYVPAKTPWSDYFNLGSVRLGTAKRPGPPTFPAPELNDSTTFGTGVRKHTDVTDALAGLPDAIRVTGEGTVEGEATVTHKIELDVSDWIKARIGNLERSVVKLTGHIQMTNGNGPGGLGHSSPDAVSPLIASPRFTPPTADLY
ncbi:hypothetical protein JQ604_12095 [Bradyrhizobium jicamae]|uniref:hypothetical protein n=1 Tax=Bradyrhizobium jicamae TaxID=280332 RepID=UPI001BA58687|nr:hypothetical protein [Bradyrhizobium jicamae]MBR0752927.1 hypothetical protein [Bradyrhizobium jicamae]